MRNLKSKFIYAIVLSLIIMAVAGCNGPEPSFDSALLIGKWQHPVTAADGTQGNLYYRYDLSGGGATWDTSDDVTEDEAQIFTWTLDGATLTLLLQGDMGQVVPKVYTLTALTATTLTYKDDYGNTSSFAKAN